MGIWLITPARLIVAGMALLCASLWPVGGILRSLCPGAVRKAWTCLGAMIVSFAVGFAAVGWRVSATAPTETDWIIASLLFSGAWFVLGVASLSRQTMLDVVRVATLEREAMVDPLTGLFNRRRLTAHLAAEIARTRRYGRSLSVLLIDIDHFKRVNDGHGHQAGDDVLRAVADALRARVRPSDFVARYGGEEMLVVAPETDARAAAALGERLRLAVESLAVRAVPTGAAVPVTASIGLASLRADDDPFSLVAAADRALYQAKREGRNCVRGRAAA